MVLFHVTCCPPDVQAMAELQMPGLALEESITVRVPFPNEVTERKQLKQVLVAMAQAAASRTGQP